MPAWLIVLSALGSMASLISGLKNIFGDAHDQINKELDDIFIELGNLRQELIRATAQILEAIDGVVRVINDRFADQNMAAAYTALYNDLAIFNDKEAAGGKSLEAARALYNANDIVLLTPFIYVVNIRLCVMIDFSPNYYCIEQFRREFQDYLDRLKNWIATINNLIAQTNTVEVSIADDFRTVEGREIHFRYWEAVYLHQGVVADAFEGPENNLSESARRRVEQQANAARLAGIEADRKQYGVVEMENTAAAWIKAFMGNLRLALVTQVLSRPVMAIDFNPDGVMIDGRILPIGLDLRATLLELLSSHEFRNRIKKAWDAFMTRGDDRIALFAYRRLFSHDTMGDKIAVLRGIASNYGYGAFIATLLYCEEYEERWGRGLPGGGEPVPKALEFTE